MTTPASMAMSSMLRLSGSFALRGLARAAAAQKKGASGAGAMAPTTTSTASSSMHRLFASLFALPGFASCYSGVTFVPGTESDPEYSLKDYDVDALLASQQRPLAAAVLFKTFWKYYLLHEALHANTYFMEIDRLEQEEFERGGGPLQNWPPYFSGAREWRSLLATAAKASGRETAVKLVRLGLAGFACSVCDDLSAQRSAFKLLKDAGKSVARKKELARDAAESLLSGASSSSLVERLAAGSAARWQRGPALAAAAGATAFRSGFLFSLADFIVSATVETAKALLDAAREEAKGSSSSEGGGRAVGGEIEGVAEQQEALAPPRRENSGLSGLFHRLFSGILEAVAPLVDAASALLGIDCSAAAAAMAGSSSSSTSLAALAGLARSLAVALAYACATPSLVRGGTEGLSTAAASSGGFVLAGVVAGSLALAASATALRAALGERRAAALAAQVSRAAVRCSVGLSATSLACGCAAVLLPAWTWPAVQLAADNAASLFLVAPAMREQLEQGRVEKRRAAALSAALAAGCVAAVGVL